MPCRVRLASRAFVVGLAAFLPAAAVGAEAEEYDYGAPASALTGFAFSFGSDGAFDWTGDGEGDNAIGRILWTLDNLSGANSNDQIRRAIESGEFALGAAWPLFREQGIVDAAALRTDILFLDARVTDPAARDALPVDRRSFLAQAGPPLHVFAAGEVAGGRWQAGPATLPVIVPLGGVALQVVLEEVRVEGDLAADAHGIAVANGAISAIVSLESLAGALNAFLLSNACDCLGLEDALIRLDGDSGRYVCDAAAAAEGCDTAEGTLCLNVAGVCSVLLNLIQTNVDIDRDADGVDDALSLHATFAMAGVALLPPTRPADCNGNSTADADDIAGGVSVDVDGNGLPDECAPPPPAGTPFHRGDVNQDASMDLSDGIGIFTYLFLGGARPVCLEAADVNNSAEIDISDGISVLNFLFNGGPPPAAPGPPPEPCGLDPDAIGSPGHLGCDAYRGCP